jgi:polyisoprenoid-binding protein YceI
MKKVFLLAVLGSTLVFGQKKNVISSDIHWWGYKVSKSEATSHDGTIQLKSGNLEFKKNALVGGSFVLDMNSINATDTTGDRQTKLNAHLKNGDFFETEKFPLATFTITNAKKNADKTYNVLITGDLTVKGKTNPVTFPAQLTSKDGVVTLQSNKFSFDRQKFDITYQAKMKDVFVKDDIDMQVKLTAK